MRPPRRAVLYLTLIGLGGCGDQPRKATRESPTNPADSNYAVAPADTAWSDPAPHRAGYAFSRGVRIHYLDFSGRGEPLVFLTGLVPEVGDGVVLAAPTLRIHALIKRT